MLNLPNLIKFTIQYSPIYSRADVRHLSRWVRRAVSSSQHLYALRLQSDALPSERGTNLSFDGLVNHLAHRHGRTLRILDLGAAYIGQHAVSTLASLCGCLEELTVGLRAETLVSFLFWPCFRRRGNH